MAEINQGFLLSSLMDPRCLEPSLALWCPLFSVGRREVVDSSLKTGQVLEHEGIPREMKVRSKAFFP